MTSVLHDILYFFTGYMRQLEAIKYLYILYIQPEPQMDADGSSGISDCTTSKQSSSSTDRRLIASEVRSANTLKTEDSDASYVISEALANPHKIDLSRLSLQELEKMLQAERDKQQL